MRGSIRYIVPRPEPPFDLFDLADRYSRPVCDALRAAGLPPTNSHEGGTNVATDDQPMDGYWVHYWVADIERGLAVVLAALAAMGAPADTAVRVRSGAGTRVRQLAESRHAEPGAVADGGA